MTQHVDFEKYKNFVNEVTSKPSKGYGDFTERLSILAEQGFPSERLLTASVGMCAEAGEFTEVVKKIVFQGKPVNNDNLFPSHDRRHLQDNGTSVSQHSSQQSLQEKHQDQYRLASHTT